ncbi:sensor histidine kinase [Sporomusa acidovorans]|uniref:histidine kinase n=1 Tax=Sporomusa acidovorans (strain ATCC 49682 / DSM 3132 / Mol) TaxID=1123286 RepID=A0ABZ3IWS8_SPOA4|nr:ATP-binding protein [Sporomusa acidovorans]OZC23669.1 alkaline phosphatase synthesis sensor protein PhoR [Sporomusa acidovorans DSM 3132]SDE24573.1 two-component system, OmpR family, phosphate regulon sensor histidine kinase PhoR [Sporomusa acidovorans]
MFTRNLRNRLVISFLALILFTLLALGGYILWFFYQHNIASLNATMLNQAKIIEELIYPDMAGPIQKGQIDEKVKELSSRTDLRVTVVDTTGVVIADSQQNPALMENHSDRSEIAQALAGNNGYSVRASTTLDRSLLYVSTPIYYNNEITGVVRVAIPLDHVDEGYRRILSALLVASCLTFLVAISFSLALAYKYTRPLERIIDTANEIAQGELSKRIFIKTGDELELLAHSLNNLTSSLEDKVTDIIAQNHKLELILENMGDAVILLDRFGKVTTANKTAIISFGITEQMLGQHNIQVIGNSLLEQAAQDTLRLKQSRVIDLKTNIHDKKRVFQVFLAPMMNGEQEPSGILAVFHDITTLQEIHDRQADFVTNASHELATPLTAIKGFAETLLDGALTQPELGKKFVRIIYDESDRMHRLIQDLLQLARLDAQEYREQIKLEPVAILSVLTAAKQDLTPRWQQKKQVVALECCQESINALAHPDWLKQVVVNLLENSIKYTPEAGKITLSCWLEDNQVKLAVKDSGIGIPAKDLPLIFDRFYRVDKARTRSAGGSGLGLAIVKFIVEMLGGRIDVESQVNVGTTFTITLSRALEP